MSRKRSTRGRVTPRKPAQREPTLWPAEEKGPPPLDVVLRALESFEGIGDRSPLEIELTISNLLGELGAGQPWVDDGTDIEELLDGLVELCLEALDHNPPRVIVDFLWVLDAFDVPWIGWPLHQRLETSLLPTQPAWAGDVGQSSVVAAHLLSHETGDGDFIALVARHRSAQRDHVVAVYVDRNLGGLAADILVHPDAQRYLEVSAESGLEISEIGLADAAVALDRAVNRSYELTVPLVADNFPTSIELVEHLLRKLPTDGVDPLASVPAGPAEVLGVVERFLSSLTGMRHRDDEEVLLAAVEFVNDELGGDPLRWTPAVTEIVLEAWFPSSGFVDMGGDRFIELLRAFVPWAHQEHGWGDRHLADLGSVFERDEREIPDVLRQALDAGVDLDDEAALDAFLDQYLDG